MGKENRKIDLFIEEVRRKQQDKRWREEQEEEGDD